MKFKNKIFAVYKIINPKGEIYIGCSANVHKRWQMHKSSAPKTRRRLHLSFAEYGVHNHIFDICTELPSDVSTEVALRYEYFYWKQYSDCGYKMINKAPMSEIPDAITRRRMSIAGAVPVAQYSMKGKWIKDWPSAIAATVTLNLHEGGITKCCKKELYSTGGFLWKYLADNSVFEIKQHVNPRAKPILQYDLAGNFIKEWDCIRHATVYLGVGNAGNISTCAKGKSKSYKGYIWKYKNQP